MAEGGLFGLPATRTYVGLVRALARAAKDEDATGYFVRLGDTSFDFARSDEIGRLLASLRATGRPVVCHANTLGNASVWMLLRGCDRIWLSPLGDVEAVGIAGQVVYVKGALDKLNVQADFIAMGKYKSFAESLTREGPTEEARESLLGVLRSLRTAWRSDVAAVGAAPHGALEAGPFTPGEAKKAGLVHDIGYERDAIDDVKVRGNGDRWTAGFGPKASGGGGFGLVEILRILSGADESAGGRPHIAVVPMSGSISMAGGGLMDDGGITLAAARKTLRKLARDDAVRVVVLRIDSPGGSALASDLIWHEVRTLSKKKKVIASVGDMAASGGYYIASAADRIVAERTSIVGSIGVVGGKIVVGQALARVGVSAETFPASDAPDAADRAAYLSALTPWSEPMRERVRAQMQNVYDVFLARVAEGRGLGVADVTKHAEGRIWSGSQALERKLIDEHGGLLRAIEMGREMAELDADAPVVVSGLRETLLDALLLDDDAEPDEVAAALSRRRALLALQPFGSVAEPTLRFLAAMGPLAGREKVVVAMPFVLGVR